MLLLSLGTIADPGLQGEVAIKFVLADGKEDELNMVVKLVVCIEISPIY